MRVHAYPTGAATPVDATAARGIADKYFPRQAGDEITTVITEFDTCFVVSGVLGPLAANGEGVPPPLAAGSMSVIDKETGAVSLWPTYPVAWIAEQYAKARAEGGVVVEDAWPK
ncbi:hypothetical protein IU433_25825 [Nocardia puris]|uniref:Immunity protein 35 of polymorphic toxin system n=1 Tax=Nocardia puris TaxID=208602 RepID=A0A366E688_9NOCA|nr:hypothetical protein [Nocardia puris]MBF6214672.1 hypothetical protein [Nocardia puris]MBF6368854.1 hypothetical protein [Nocardia puris]MBF6462434.1 hypothetical protein [Nocardia puris]RBO97014.1 hypothetical protein DFR74_1011033 [Nocardia puris]